MSKDCCVCGESKVNPDNRLFTCKGHGCDVTVHQGCYGIVTPPTGLWFCRKCESQERAARVRCELCPKKEGALKRTDSGSWAHVVCALYIPEVVFGNNRKMEPIVTSKLPRERFSKSCYICEERGLETQATYGACMACHKSSCRQAFHVTCAQKESLLCEEEDPRDPRNVVYCGYCSMHYKKMMRQKHKQILRKQSVTPTSTAAPSFPLAPPPAGAISSVTSHLSSSSSTLPAISQQLHSSTKDTTKPAKREKSSSGESPPKRLSTDTPIPVPPTKRKRRTRKLSSSNESTTSEAPSNSSDLQNTLLATNIPGSPSSFVHSPPSIVVGGVSTIPSTSLLLSSTSSGGGVAVGVGKEHFMKQEMVGGEGESDMVSKMHAEMLGAGPLSPIQGAGIRRQPGSSTSSDNSNRSQAPPPRSLQELLERQWEQTAQFILDQAGKQNNAGTMLAHLHELQSENRSMQSRIMELASQREFYIAINTKLQQTLTDNNLVRLPNGVQPIAAGPGGGATGAVGVALGGATTGMVGVAMGGDGLHPQQQQQHQPQAQAMAAAISSGQPPLPPGANRGGVANSGGMYEEEPRMQEDNGRAVLENSGDVMHGAILMDDERMSVSSTAIPKEAQDSLLHAHFSSMQRGSAGSGEGRRVKSSGLHVPSGRDHARIHPTELKHDPMLSSVAEPPNQRNSGGGAGGSTGGGGGGRAGPGGAYGGPPQPHPHPRHPLTAHDQQQLMNNSNNVMLSSGFSSSGVNSSGRHSQHHHHHEHERHAATTELLTSSHQLLESGGDRLAAPPVNEGGTTPSLNEVTHVTAAVQRPIASFGSPLNDTSPMLSSAVGHPPQSSNNVYFHHNPSS